MEQENERIVPIISRKGANIGIHDLSTFILDHFSPGTFAIRFDSFLLIHVLQGKGSCRMDMKEFDLLNDSFYCLYPGQLIAPGADAVMGGTVITFTPEFLSSSNEDFLMLLRSDLFDIHGPCNVTLSDELKPEIRQFLQTMYREYTESGELCHELLSSLLRVLIIMLGRRSAVKNSEGLRRRDVDQVNAFYELVSKHFIELKKVSEYADLLGIPPSYLNVLVKRVSGFSAKHYIQQQILMAAKRQIHWEGKNLKEIAYDLGYSDTSHFSKFFKNVAGINFSEFRRGQPLS